MDPPIVNETSFSVANPSSYSLAELWPFPISGTGELGGLGVRMGNLSDCLDVAAVSVDESTVTEQSGSHGGRDGGGGRSGGRKRKDLNCEDDSSKLVSTSCGNNLNNSNAKRTKASGVGEEICDLKAEGETSSQTGNGKPEAPKDYIHVRARRGQATDSHSLAERARREKISERMKMLQDLVPGCNKVIGKALVLDEIINYIQSLQHQVEFLSMKLEAVNSRMNPNIEGFPSKDVAAPTFDATAMIFGQQAAREYAQGTQPEWLHMQVGSSFERAV